MKSDRKPPHSVVIVGAVVLSVGVLATRAAHADEELVSLSWSAPEGCPAETYVLAETMRLLGSPSPLDKTVTARAVVRHRGREWRVDVVTSSEGTSGRRSFRARSCEELAKATALSVALAVNPDKASGPLEPVVVVEEEPPPRPPERTPLDATAPPPPTLRFMGGLMGGADLGTLPRVTWSARGFGGVAFADLRLALALSAAPSRDIAFSGAAGASFTKFSGGPRAAYALSARPVEIAPTLAVEVDHLRATAYGITNPLATGTTWVETLAGGSVTAFLNPTLGLRIEGFFGFPWPRRSFGIEPLGVVHVVPGVTGTLGFGVESRF